MLLPRIVVGLAVLATLWFNGSYAYSRGDGLPEKLGLVLLAVIIDLAKTSLLAGAAHLRDRRHYLAAVLLFLLWWPAIGLSTWAGYSYVATNRAASAADKTATSESRARAQLRYDQAKRTVELASAAEAYAASAGCTRPKTATARQFCADYDKATAALAAADTALSAPPATRADPETELLASQLGVSQRAIELTITLLPAIFLELISSLGFYAVTRRSGPIIIRQPAEPPQELLQPVAAVGTRPSTEKPPQPAAKRPVPLDDPPQEPTGLAKARKPGAAAPLP